MKANRIVVAVFLMCTLAICAAGCDASAMPVPTVTPEAAVPTSTPAPFPVPSPSATTVPSPTLRPSPIMTATSVPPAAATIVPSTPAPEPLVPMGESGSTDLSGDGRRDTVLHAADTEQGTQQLMLNGLVYDTGIPRSDGETTFYNSDIDGDGASELIAVSRADRGALLRLYRLTPSGLVAATFTYTVPAELSDSGETEYREDSDSLLFSGIDPVVSLGDGSFAVLAFGSGFQRYTLGPDMRVVESETLPLDILSGGHVPENTSTPTDDMSE